jgi:hypothetical protein
VKTYGAEWTPQRVGLTTICRSPFWQSGRSRKRCIGYSGGEPARFTEGNVTQSRAADDFLMIRSRMEELRRERNRANVNRPRAADDFATIRARMEELRRERAQMLADQNGRSPIYIGPRPYYRATNRERGDQSDRIIPRSILGVFVR